MTQHKVLDSSLSVVVKTTWHAAIGIVQPTEAPEKSSMKVLLHGDAYTVVTTEVDAKDNAIKSLCDHLSTKVYDHARTIKHQSAGCVKDETNGYGRARFGPPPVSLPPSLPLDLDADGAPLRSAATTFLTPSTAVLGLAPLAATPSLTLPITTNWLTPPEENLEEHFRECICEDCERDCAQALGLYTSWES